MLVGIAVVSIVASTLQAQRVNTLQAAVRVLAQRVDTTVITAAGSLNLSVGCQVTRGVSVALAGYLGYLIGELAQFPLALQNGGSASVAVDVAGAVAGIVLIADAPVSRPLPFCPEELHTLSNRPTTHAGACRASRVLNAGLGAAAGVVAAGAVAIPFVLSNSGRTVVNGLLIALPAVGAIAGAIRSGNAPPCTS